MSRADQNFIRIVKDILENGTSDNALDVRPHWEDGTPAHTISVFGAIERYNITEEFPIMTLRRTYWKSAWDEILWIWQQKSSNVHDLGSHVWDAWADENGSIGKAYGYQIGELARCKEVNAEGLRKAFGDDLSGKTIRQDENGIYLLDQMDHVIYQLVNDPASRRIIANMYNVNEIADMALAPCAYSMTFNVSYKEGHDKPILSAMLNQRSQDMLTANNWNTVQYSLLVYALAQAYGFEPGEFIHVIGSAHIYDRHIPIIEKLIEQPQYDAPKLIVNPDIHDFYAFDKNNAFAVENYRYNEFADKIEVAV